jgi:hypothetical protein
VNATASAARGFVAVFLAAFAFFGFVVASGTLGDVAQAAVGTAIAIVVLGYVWSRLDRQRRDRILVSARRLWRRTPGER